MREFSNGVSGSADGVWLDRTNTRAPFRLESRKLNATHVSLFVTVSVSNVASLARLAGTLDM